MMIKKRVGVFGICFLVLAVLWTSAVAAEETAGDYFHGMGTKIGRGVENILTSPADIPCTMKTEISDQGGVGALTGLGKGMLFMVRRMFVGVCEVGTFMIPMERTIPRVCQEKKAAVV